MWSSLHEIDIDAKQITKLLKIMFCVQIHSHPFYHLRLTLYNSLYRMPRTTAFQSVVGVEILRFEFLFNHQILR